MVEEEAKKYGLSHAIVVNAHNCLTDIDDTKEHLAELERAAKKCIQNATAQPKKALHGWLRLGVSRRSLLRSRAWAQAA